MNGQLLTSRTCSGLKVLLLLLLAVTVPAAAAPLTSPDDPTTTTTSTEATTPAATQGLFDSLPEKERVALMAFELAAALQRLAEQAAAAGAADVTEEATAHIVTRQSDASDYSDDDSSSGSASASGSREQPAATTPLHRALSLAPLSASVAKSISLSEKFQSIVNRWVHKTSNARLVNVRAKITICFPFNVCFEIQNPWGVCCPF